MEFESSFKKIIKKVPIEKLTAWETKIYIKTNILSISIDYEDEREHMWKLSVCINQWGTQKCGCDGPASITIKYFDHNFYHTSKSLFPRLFFNVMFCLRFACVWIYVPERTFIEFYTKLKENQSIYGYMIIKSTQLNNLMRQRVSFWRLSVLIMVFFSIVFF